MSYDEARMLHLAGLDDVRLSQDAADIFGNDPYAADVHSPPAPDEHLPQFGPPFVRYVVDSLSALQAQVNKATGVWSYKPQTVVVVAGMQTTAAGAVNRAVTPNAVLYEVNPGFTLAIHRIAIASLATFGAPFSAAGAYWELRVNDEMVDGGSLVAGSGSLPVVKSWGTRDAPRARSGEIVSMLLNAGPASQQITAKLQGTLERHEES